MSSKITTSGKTSKPATGNTSVRLFEKTNYMWMLLGVAVMALGCMLMAGGRSDDPNVFKPEEVYSKMRITVAPILILAGLVIEIFALFRNPKN